MTMSERIQTIKTYAQVSYDRIAEVTKDLKPEQLDWKSCKEANTIRWILTHLVDDILVYLPNFLPSMTAPKDWPKDYVGNPGFKLEKILSDVEKSKQALMKGLDKLNVAQLNDEVDMWGSKAKREYAIMTMISEVLHHEGQIAAILGLEKRMKK